MTWRNDSEFCWTKSFPEILAACHWWWNQRMSDFQLQVWSHFLVVMLRYRSQWSVVSSCIVEHFVSKSRTAKVHSWKIAYDRINGNFFVMMCPSCHAIVCTMPCVQLYNGARAGTRVISMMDTESAVVKTNGWSLWWNQHIGILILMTVSMSERLSMQLLGQWCSEIETGSIAFHTSLGLILHECKSVINIH